MAALAAMVCVFVVGIQPAASQPNLAVTRAGWRLVLAAMLSGLV